MADHREVQRIEAFLMEWLDKHGVRATREFGHQFVAIGEVEEKSGTAWHEIDRGLGCCSATLQLVNITRLARDLADELATSERCAQIVREEWHRAVKQFGLRPGSPTEAVVSRVQNRIYGIAT